jgi:asparagine synthase (glutamine-hydrolysing)
MCGIAGIVQIQGHPVPDLQRRLQLQSALLAHRGPDGSGTWVSPRQDVGFCHRRLAIIDLSKQANQPMKASNDTVITYNGEIYNYLELRQALGSGWKFRSTSDTECILASYSAEEIAGIPRFRGMFAFGLWDEHKRRFLAARDRFGIKPFYYAVVDDSFYFASEIKALLPFLPAIETDPEALSEYLTFQYTLGERTLFKGVHQLLPGHWLMVENGVVKTGCYWDVQYEVDFDHSPRYFERQIAWLVNDSLKFHLRADVPIGAYLSGGIDSTLIAILAAKIDHQNRPTFHGRFTDYAGYDESQYAVLAARKAGSSFHPIDITAADFRNHIHDIIWHLDVPVAGPGSFPQYMVSELASHHVKVVLGGQGGDEVFGGYARYLIAYFEQCIKAAIDGTYKNGHYVVTIESIVPNLGVLREYMPMIREFWRDGLFGELDARYFRLIDRSSDMVDEVDWSLLNKERVFEAFREIFDNRKNVRKEAYFDKMTHFDFKCLLPALLHVEDRMSMAHGLESRVPLLDHLLVELAASTPADVKFGGGNIKHLLKRAVGHELPELIVNRRDKMGFPVPLKEWFAKELRDFVQDLFRSQAAQTRRFFNSKAVLSNFDKAERFSRKTWGLISLEIWHQLFHDRAAQIRWPSDIAQQTLGSTELVECGTLQ